MTTYTQVAAILQKSLGQEEGLLVLEYIENRIPPDVARQRDVSQTEAALRLEIEKVRREIEKVRADLSIDIEKVRADLSVEIEKVRADLSVEIEKVRADLSVEIEKVRADLSAQIERSTAAQTRWAFLFWISQMVVLLGLLFTVLSRLQP